MADHEEEMYFFIADISGYTNYMIKNQTDFTHGTLVISQLIKSLVNEIQVPMEISKLEGDAIFLFLRESKIPQEIRNDPALLSKKLLQFFTIFFANLCAMEESNVCNCGACKNIDKLNLKIVVHYGKALIDKIGSFEELSGVDVIIPHRLLKNKIKEKCYLLLTEAVYKKLPLPPEGKTAQGEEHDKDLGVIPVYIYYPAIEKGLAKKRELSFFEQKKEHYRLVLGGLLLKLGLKKPGTLRNLPPPKE